MMSEREDGWMMVMMMSAMMLHLHLLYR